MGVFRLFSLLVLLVFFSTSQSCSDKEGSHDDAKPSAVSNLDFEFEDSISEQVLKNYLSRSMTYSFISVPYGTTTSDASVITDIGAKYVSRAIIPWEAEVDYSQTITNYKNRIAQVHQKDPEVILEACIFETVFPSSESTPIPDWVFMAFDRPVAERNFSYDAMLFPDGRYVDHWGGGGSVPDISQEETQMYFYYRACRYIDAGFEAIHWGQVTLMGEMDAGYQSFYDVLAMVREYASVHARRNFVLNNGHTHGIVNSSGNLLFDFHSYPARLKAPANSVSHAPSASNPQEAILEQGYIDAIYGRSLGGKTPSGWSCESLPYFVEIDNYGGHVAEKLHHPDADYWPWGMDEISWYVNQPQSYRTYWLDYAYRWVQSADEAGFLCLPGSRPYYSLTENKIGWYFCHAPSFDDQNTIRDLWLGDAAK